MTPFNALRARALRALRPPRLLDDDYLRCLDRAIAGMQHAGNPYLFDLAVGLAPPAPMLAIGARYGLSTNVIQYLKRRHGRHEPLFCCDRWLFKGAEQPLPAAAGITRAGLREHAIESFRRNTLRFSGEELPHAIEATGEEMFAAWRAGARVRDVFDREARLGGPLGFCFIDGNHAVRHVERDFEGCDEQLLPGGLILFDDSGEEGDRDVRRVVTRVRRSPRYEVIGRNPNYLVRKLG